MFSVQVRFRIRGWNVKFVQYKINVYAETKKIKREIDIPYSFHKGKENS